MLQIGRSGVPFSISSIYLNPSSRTMALELTKPLTEMSTTNLPRDVKRGRRVNLTTSPISESNV
jgi:hypothetical protein